MSNCLTSARYNWRVDLYEQATTQDESGAINRDWDYSTPTKRINCLVETIQVRGMSVGNSDETWGAQYENIEWLRLTTNQDLDKSFRVGNIVDRNLKKMFPDNSVFEVVGRTPLSGPFGSISEYQYMIRRAEL